MPEGPELNMELEGEDGYQPVRKDEMLYASQSTLENAEDGTILREEYHLKLVTESGFEYQVGCLTDAIVTSDNTAILMEKLGETFEAVEMGDINEDDYFFELISPYFYYTSGNYHLSDQVQTTLLAMANTSSFESEEYSLREDIVCTLLASDASYNPKVLPFLDFGQAPTNPKKGIRENNKKSQRNASRQTKQVKMKSLHFFENDCKFQCNAPRQTRKVKIKFLHVFGRRSVGGNLLYISMIQLFIVVCARIMMVGALPVNTEPESPLTLTAGSDGVIQFECRNEQQSASKYYTVKFEEKDRPFYIDGAFDLEGLMSPDQAERFRVEYFEEGSSMSLEINIASVSVEDQGTYIVLLIIQGETPEYHLMKRLVLILIPPGPAVCFLMPSETMMKMYEVHCHSRPGNGDSTLTCFQNGMKIPYHYETGDTQIVYRRIFWLVNTDIPLSCCSHDIKEIPIITQTSCDQFIYPRIELANSPVPPVNEIPTKITPTTRTLVLEDNTKQPSHVTSLYSGCTSSRNINWPVIIVPIMAIFTFACIINLKLKFNSIFKGNNR